MTSTPPAILPHPGAEHGARAEPRVGAAEPGLVLGLERPPAADERADRAADAEIVRQQALERVQAARLPRQQPGVPEQRPVGRREAALEPRGGEAEHRQQHPRQRLRPGRPRLQRRARATPREEQQPRQAVVEDVEKVAQRMVAAPLARQHPGGVGRRQRPVRTAQRDVRRGQHRRPRAIDALDRDHVRRREALAHLPAERDRREPLAVLRTRPLLPQPLEQPHRLEEIEAVGLADQRLAQSSGRAPAMGGHRWLQI